MQNRRRPVLGLLIVAVGILWTLSNLGLIPSGIGRYWPLLLVFWGLDLLLFRSHKEE